MSRGTATRAIRRQLKPVQRRTLWISWGLALQAIGVAIPVVTAVRRADREGLGNSLTHYTYRLIWHEMLRSGADVALIALGLIVFIAGAVLLARPFVTDTVTLFVAVPVAALAGVAILGVVVLLVAAAIALLDSSDGSDLGSLFNSSGSSGSSRRRKRRK